MSDLVSNEFERTVGWSAFTSIAERNEVCSLIITGANNWPSKARNARFPNPAIFYWQFGF